MQEKNHTRSWWVSRGEGMCVIPMASVHATGSGMATAELLGLSGDNSMSHESHWRAASERTGYDLLKERTLGNSVDRVRKNSSRPLQLLSGWGNVNVSAPTFWPSFGLLFPSYFCCFLSCSFFIVCFLSNYHFFLLSLSAFPFSPLSFHISTFFSSFPQPPYS